jgi:predicted amidohydrolase
MFIAGFVQFAPARYDVARNSAALAALLADVRADLIVLPELANSGYMYRTPAELAPYAEPADGSGPYLSRLRELAAHTGGVIVSGFAERAAEGLYNSAAAVTTSGVVALYRKTHLFLDEQDLFLPGDTGFVMFEHAGARIGLMVCFDWYFPESARTLALHGSQVIAHPSNLVLPHCQTAMITRCLENRVYAITTNRYGMEELDGKPLTFTGASQLVSPRGERLLQAPVDGDCVLTAQIALSLADDKHVTARNDLFANRRPELYDL